MPRFKKSTSPLQKRVGKHKVSAFPFGPKSAMLAIKRGGSPHADIEWSNVTEFKWNHPNSPEFVDDVLAQLEKTPPGEWLAAEHKGKVVALLTWWPYGSRTKNWDLLQSQIHEAENRCSAGSLPMDEFDAWDSLLQELTASADLYRAEH